MFKFLTGVKPSGQFHLGNYISTIAPILDKLNDTLFLIADAHTLTAHNKDIYQNATNIIKILKSFGIENIIIQSQVPEIFELNWILSCYTAKGLLNRAHAYKSLTTENINKMKDIDKGIYTGLYNYPTLMTADLAMFDTEYVMIGPDQVQHIELAKDIVNKFNYEYKTDILNVPKPIVSNVSIEGYDGRKMSKSYNNTIPLMCSEKKLRKHIYKIKTNDKNVGESKQWNESPITQLYQSFNGDVEELKNDMLNGISWGEIKERTFVLVNNHIKDAREKYGIIDDNINTNVDIKPKEKIDNIKKLIGLRRK